MNKSIPPDKLEKLQGAVRDLRDRERQVADLEERLKQLKTEISDLRRRTLPEIFAEAHVDRVGLPAEGNQPAIDARLHKEYKAAIPASWPTAKRETAFNTLDELELGNLQKLTFVVTFEAGQRERAEKFHARLTELNYAFSVTRAVHHATLSAALKERCEAGQVPSLAQLDSIGGYIGTSVDLKQRRE
jgi:hypothetical protein